jgi:hypothetical protein
MRSDTTYAEEEMAIFAVRTPIGADEESPEKERLYESFLLDLWIATLPQQGPALLNRE